MRPINDLCKETSHGDDDCGDQGSPQPQQKLVPIKTTLGGSLVCSFVRSLETEFVYWVESDHQKLRNNIVPVLASNKKLNTNRNEMANYTKLLPVIAHKAQCCKYHTNATLIERLPTFIFIICMWRAELPMLSLSSLFAIYYTYFRDGQQ